MAKSDSFWSRQNLYVHLQGYLCLVFTFLCMIQHNGKYGCKDCKKKGEHVQSKKGYTHAYRFKEAISVEQRNHTLFVKDAIEAANSKIISFYVRKKKLDTTVSKFFSLEE